MQRFFILGGNDFTEHFRHDNVMEQVALSPKCTTTKRNFNSFFVPGAPRCSDLEHQHKAVALFFESKEHRLVVTLSDEW